jgi:hypothetical protein
MEIAKISRTVLAKKERAFKDQNCVHFAQKESPILTNCRG